jgi:hypothetical protein
LPEIFLNTLESLPGSKNFLTVFLVGGEILFNKINTVCIFSVWHEICLKQYTFLSFADSLLHKSGLESPSRPFFVGFKK